MTRAAVIQMRGDGDLAQNLATAGRWLDEAAAAGARLAVLPENFAYYGRRDLDRAAEDEDSENGPAVVGRTLIVDEQPLTVIGVAARGFRGVALEHHARTADCRDVRPSRMPSSTDRCRRRAARWLAHPHRAMTG